MWIIISAVGAIRTLVPAMDMTDAADAAMPSILTVTSYLLAYLLSAKSSKQ